MEIAKSIDASSASTGPPARSTRRFAMTDADELFVPRPKNAERRTSLGEIAKLSGDHERLHDYQGIYLGREAVKHSTRGTPVVRTLGEVLFIATNDPRAMTRYKSGSMMRHGNSDICRERSEALLRLMCIRHCKASDHEQSTNLEGLEDGQDWPRA